MGMSVNSGISAASFGAAVQVKEKKSWAERRKRGKSSKNERPKKSVNYNPREISSQIVRASRSSTASVVLVRAKSRLSILQRQLASGQYKDSEVRSAIAHAGKMVNCSRLKLRNLKEEEWQQGRDDRAGDQGDRARRREAKRRVRKKELELKARISMEETQRALRERVRRQELLRKRRMHRSEELGKLTKAEMEYLQDKCKESQGTERISYSGVVLELSSAQSELAALKMEEQMIERQIQSETGAAGAGTDGAPGVLAEAGIETADASSAGTEAAAAAVSIDVTV